MSNAANPRQFVIRIIFVGIAAVILIRLFFLQIFEDKYKVLANDIAIYKKVVYPPRGVIYDRKGKVMLYNQVVYDLMVTPNSVPKNLDTVQLCLALGMDKDAYVKLLNRVRIKNGGMRQTPLPGGPNKAVHCVPGCKSACRWAIAAAKFRACSSSSRYENGRFRMRPEGRISPGRGVHIGGCQRRTHALSTSSTKSVAGRTQVTTVTTGTTVTSKSVACRVPSACKSRSIDTSFNFSNMRKGRGSLPEPNMRTICG